MKKVIFTLVIAAVGFTANAQTAQGNWLMGGNASFTSGKSSADGAKSNTTINISPDAGYFVADDLAIGAMVSFQSATGGYSAFSAAPFVRYYFLPIGDNAKLFGQGSFGFGSSKFDDDDESVSSTNWSIAAGPAFFLNQNVALETTLFYGSSKQKDVPAYNTFGLNIGFQIHLGGGSTKKK